MSLEQAIIAAGMTPPRRFVEGRWLRFPGVGKGRANRSGWCRVISPTMAIFGDWSSGLREVWTDQSHQDDQRSRKALREAQERERRFAKEQALKQAQVASYARALVDDAIPSVHPYLARKGFPQLCVLTLEDKLVVPVMDLERYPQIISAQLITESGEKKFLTGGRAKGGVHRLGSPPAKARRIALCEGYATGLSIEAALKRLPGAYCVIVCFSASNLELVARMLPHDMNPFVCADHDVSGTGEQSAIRTGLRWAMPAEPGDWNDVHCQRGLYSVVEALRKL